MGLEDRAKKKAEALRRQQRNEQHEFEEHLRIRALEVEKGRFLTKEFVNLAIKHRVATVPILTGGPDASSPSNWRPDYSQLVQVWVVRPIYVDYEGVSSNGIAVDHNANAHYFHRSGYSVSRLEAPVGFRSPLDLPGFLAENWELILLRAAAEFLAGTPYPSEVDGFYHLPYEPL